MTIESILKRTIYDDYKIVVLDSSPATGRERQYLRKHRDNGSIELLERDEGQLGHGETINKLLKDCNTELACLLDSDVEILEGDWLSVLADPIRDNKDLGVGDLRKGGCFIYSSIFRGPLYHPSCLLLNMPAYRRFGSEDDWPEQGVSMPGKGIPMAEYKYRHKFENRPLSDIHPFVYNFDPRMAEVHYDTGGRFSEKVLWENPEGLRMHPMPPDFFKRKIIHFEGMSAHSTRLGIDLMKPRVALLRERLRLLRAG